jgi:hypothetical protein
MRLMSAALLTLALIVIAQPSYAGCPSGYVDCGRGVCCPR